MLGIHYVPAGDWWAAALALGQLHRDAQHEQQLLVARQERKTHGGGSSSNAGGDDTSGKGLSPGASDQHVQPTDGLRLQLQLQGAEHYAGLSRSTADALLSVR
jgi:hypothetical protein